MRNHRERRIFNGVLGAAWVVAFSGSIHAQMVSPSIDDRPGPFSYFSKPTDELGVPGAASGAEITPEGYLYTGFGELMFFTGPDRAPVEARIRTLEDGHLPVFSYSVSRLGIEYRFTVFAAPAGASRQTVLFVRVSASNPGNARRAAFLTSALRYQAEQTTEMPSGDNRFVRPIPDGGLGQFHQPGEAFRNDWIYSSEHDAFLRDGRALYLFPATPKPALSLTLRSHYNRVRSIDARPLDVQPTTPTLVASYQVVIEPHESRTFDFKMPLIPVKTDTPEFAEVAGARFDTEHAATTAMWRQTLDRGMRIELPEAKATDTFDASLVYDLMALNDVEGQAVQTVNDFQYHRFYLRDAADFVRMYDATGYSDIAARVLAFFPSRQQPDGNFLSQPGQYDGWGEALWAFGEHYRRTHDLAFANAIYPRVVRAVDWLARARAADPLGIMPKSDVRDNEYVAAHLTGYNFLALDGLRAAIELAKATQHEDDARRFQLEYDDFHRQFFALLDRAIRADGGAIPPALDAIGWQGTDWGNLLSIVPVPLLDPRDPRVTATLLGSQASYQEGITTYTEPDDGQFLHHYLTIKNTLTELVRGDQQQAIREFYAELLHTSSTHAGFEYAIRPWGSRDFEGNLAPHGWFAADYRNLLRNMMLREEGDTLHLLSAVSPEWIGSGKTIRVERAPTIFGTTAFTLRMTSDTSAVLELNHSWEHRPQALVLHLPWFMQTRSATADGVALKIEGDAVAIPVNAREVKLIWRRRPGSARMSYEKTVASYKREYRLRYDRLLSTGEMSPAVDTWRVPER
jgi:hypothetical protein